MSATDELRKLLDERGIEWKDGDAAYEIEWSTPDGRHCSAMYWKPTFSMLISGCTPEQAIAATLGNSRAERTCKQEERGWGTEGDHARVWLTCGHDCMVPTVQDLPNYCPNCGRKVVKL